jgi:hypothetical protein
MEPRPEAEPAAVLGQSIILDLDETLVSVQLGDQWLSPPSEHQQAAAGRDELAVGPPAPDFVFTGLIMGGGAAWLRPGAKAFVEYCFERFDNVALWTHASPSYRPMIEALFPEHAHRWSFDGCGCGWGDTVQAACPKGRHAVKHGASFVWFSGRKTSRTVCSSCGQIPFRCHNTGCTSTNGSAKMMASARFEPTARVHLKRLRKVWGSTEKRAAGWTRQRTLIVDDTAENALDNWGNTITILPWTHTEEGAFDDVELGRLMAYLDSESVAQCSELRGLDKRKWRSQSLALPTSGYPPAAAELLRALAERKAAEASSARLKLEEAAPDSGRETAANQKKGPPDPTTLLCRFFANGKCKRGISCQFRHDTVISLESESDASEPSPEIVVHAKPPPAVECRGPAELSDVLAAALLTQWSGAGQHRAHTHNFHARKAVMNPQAVSELLELLPGSGAVLDPFVGSGTTMIEVMLTGRPALGCDLSPLAVGIARQHCWLPSEAELDEFEKAVVAVAAILDGQTGDEAIDWEAAHEAVNAQLASSSRSASPPSVNVVAALYFVLSHEELRTSWVII